MNARRFIKRILFQIKVYKTDITPYLVCGLGFITKFAAAYRR